MGTPENVAARRCWRVDLDALAAASEPLALEPIEAFGAESPGPLPAGWSWDALLGAGGAATAVALVAWAEQREPDAGALALAVGPAVRAGLPTAARAHVAARSPLTGRLSEGLVGGELGPRLGALGAGWLIVGEVPPGACAVLRLLGPEDDGRPRAELTRLELGEQGSSEDAAQEVLRQLGAGAVLACGPAARRGVRFANLANEARPPSFVGRGGLGAVLAGLGLRALHVDGEPSESQGDADWTARLARSPRLVQRGAQGSIELFESQAARGQQHAQADLSADRAGLRRERGCRGCPTPCGWVFERGNRSAEGAHYAALAPFGGLLGLHDREAQRDVLAACDRVGVDAKESARVLRVLGIVGDARGCAREVERWGREADAQVAQGAEALATARAHSSPDLLAQAEPIQRLAARTSGGASDPMRSFPFLVDGTPNALALSLLSRWGFAPDALDPGTFEAKAQLLWWHERVVAAVDTAGFCAFSAGALLADGLATLDELIERLFDSQEAGPTDGLQGLALGDAVCRARALLDAGCEPAPSADSSLESAWREYRDLCASGELLRGSDAPASVSASPEAASDFDRRPGRLKVRASGPLGAALGSTREVELSLPARLEEVLARVVRAHPSAQPFLSGAGGSAAAAHVQRGGHSRRLSPGELLRDGDELWLVVALPGG